MKIWFYWGSFRRNFMASLIIYVNKTVQNLCSWQCKCVSVMSGGKLGVRLCPDQLYLLPIIHAFRQFWTHLLPLVLKMPPFLLQAMTFKAGALISQLSAMSQFGNIYFLPLAFWRCCIMAKYKSPSICFHKFNLEQIVSAVSFYQPQLLFCPLLGWVCLLQTFPILTITFPFWKPLLLCQIRYDQKQLESLLEKNVKSFDIYVCHNEVSFFYRVSR